MRKSVVAAMAASAALAGCHARSEDGGATVSRNYQAVSYTHLRAHET